MKYLILFTGLFLGISACSNSNIKLEQFDANKHLSAGEQTAFIQKIIYHLGKWPESANKKTVKHPHFKNDFLNEAKLHQLKYYFPKGDTIYFGTWKIAPSLKEKYRLTAGKLVLGESGPEYYEEVFRTWKMTPDELHQKGELLFTKWVNGEDISHYFNHRSGKEEWIEFPDKDVKWDIEKQTWTSPQLEVMEKLYQEKRQKMEEILRIKDSLSSH